VDVNNIAVEIFKDESYKRLCKKLAKSNFLADDLHSEFIESVLNGGEGLVRAKDEGYLNVYCVGIIHNIWGKKDRVKSYDNGQTSPMFNFSSTLDLNVSYNGELVNPVDYLVSQDGNTYNYKYDVAEKIIEKEKDHANQLRMYQARVTYYSYHKYKTPYEFSRKSGINYANIKKAIKEFKKLVITKTQNYE
jgi:hypothetical protein